MKISIEQYRHLHNECYISPVSFTVSADGKSVVLDFDWMTPELVRDVLFTINQH